MEKRKIGGSHLPIRRAVNPFPRVERGSKAVKMAISDLIREGKIRLKKTVEDNHVSLNQRLLKEIKEEINSKNVY